MISNQFHLLFSKWDKWGSKLTAQHKAAQLALARAHQNWQMQMHWPPVENTHYSGVCQQLTHSWGIEGQAVPMFISPELNPAPLGHQASLHLLLVHHPRLSRCCLMSQARSGRCCRETIPSLIRTTSRCWRSYTFRPIIKNFQHIFLKT